MKILTGALALSLCMLPAHVLAQETEAETEAETLDLNHIGLAVTKLDETADFFIDALGWKPAGGQPEYPARFVTNGKMFVTLWQVEDPATAIQFDRRKNVGLHHMAITVRDLDTLHALHEKFKALENVKIEFAPEFLGDGPTTHMIIREPSGLRLEFIVPASRIQVK
ncbi:VOC family protein [Sphingorhabdus sp. Alg239-R122]|uniref:VOC family protein n=1 Tax=Sphingorhabdus sp. Alg239-R122 TaxID=2305989 RepID=UPI001967D84D|nr:VOC family protein [Sphingorhabdus sp. Alg239-R122]